jgi:hypothetical protein
VAPLKNLHKLQFQIKIKSSQKSDKGIKPLKEKKEREGEAITVKIVQILNYKSAEKGRKCNSIAFAIKNGFYMLTISKKFAKSYFFQI